MDIMFRHPEVDAKTAAQDLLRQLGAPAWAVSVAATFDEGRWSLVVRIDPAYQASVNVPATFHGYPVGTQWRRPNFAFQTNKYA